MIYYIQLSFYFLKGNHTIAVIKGHESYELLSEGFGEVLSEINSLIERGNITIGGSVYKLEFFLGGDYKVHIGLSKMQQLNTYFSTVSTSNVGTE